MEARNYESAVQDFHSARSQAALRQILGLLKGESTQLFSFEEVRSRLHLMGGAARGLRDIPLASIVGSVGRYSDFTRDFLPLHDANLERWARVKALATDMSGFPPIEVYQIGEVYFVADGNHRVSVARSLGAGYIQAYVTEIQTRVPLTPDLQPDDLIIKAEYAGFLEATHLDELRSGLDLATSVPGKYGELLEHIQVHRYFMGLEQQREIGWEEAAVHWYDFVYWPVVEQIRAEGILASFPGRTETDLYLWIAAHRAAIEEELGWRIPQETAVADLVAHFSEKPSQIAARLGNILKEAVTPEALGGGPPVGQWRKERQQRSDRLFHELLVPLDGGESGWMALEQALRIAQREGGRIYGLHVKAGDPDTAAPISRDEADELLYAEFSGRCAAAGVTGELAVVTGDIAANIRARARWADLIVAGLRYPPPAQAFSRWSSSRWSSGFRSLIQRSPLPLLAVPNQIETLHRGLLAFNDSPKAREALYICAYLASRWGTNLTVLTVNENGGAAEETAAVARDYLQSYGVTAQEVTAQGAVSEAINTTQAEAGCDFIVMGGYHRSPVLEVMLGSVVDSVLREAAVPVLICR